MTRLLPWYLQSSLSLDMVSERTRYVTNTSKTTKARVCTAEYKERRMDSVLTKEMVYVIQSKMWRVPKVFYDNNKPNKILWLTKRRIKGVL